ncbi:retrovirus-related pol polyprotein from transposon TNT 1-94 [Tanacetum coccineum]
MLFIMSSWKRGSKDRSTLCYRSGVITVQWKSRIKRYIDTKPNRELIHYSLQNPPYIYQWVEKTVPVAEGQCQFLLNYTRMAKKHATVAEDEEIVIGRRRLTNSEATGYDNQRQLLLLGRRENVVSRECQKTNRVKDASLSQGKDGYCVNMRKLRVQLNAEKLIERFSCHQICIHITVQDSKTPNPICLMAKATLSQAWLWHFGESKKKSFHLRGIPQSSKTVTLLHMDLCGQMRVESINGKKYVLVIVDDYSRYTWTHFLRSKDETPGVLIDFLTLVQRGLHAQVTTV